MFTKYYQTCILPILSYACPAWHSYLSQESCDRLEQRQSLCLRLIHHYTQSYTERLQRSNISKINDVLLRQCKKYVNKVASDTNHCLHHLVPHKQSARGCQSSQLVDRNSQTARTAKCVKMFLTCYRLFVFLNGNLIFILDHSHTDFFQILLQYTRSSIILF